MVRKWHVTLAIIGTVLFSTGAEGCEDKTGQRGINDGKRGKEARELSESLTKKYDVTVRVAGSARVKKITYRAARYGRKTFDHEGVWERTFYDIKAGAIVWVEVWNLSMGGTFVTCEITANKKSDGQRQKPERVYCEKKLLYNPK
jgi:hypothetical protein